MPAQVYNPPWPKQLECLSILWRLAHILEPRIYNDHTMEHRIQSMTNFTFKEEGEIEIKGDKGERGGKGVEERERRGRARWSRRINP